MIKKTIRKVFETVCLFLITLSMVSIAISLSNISRKNTNIYDINKDNIVDVRDLLRLQKEILKQEVK